MKKNTKLIGILLLVFLTGIFVGYSINETRHNNDVVEPVAEPAVEENITIAEDGKYYSKEDVGLYLHTYNHLPDNYVTKAEVRNMGWRNGDDIWAFCDGCVIGGDNFQNKEKLLPEKESRQYYECDVYYYGGERGGYRIIYSNDGLVYYTGDHYVSYELLYGEE